MCAGRVRPSIIGTALHLVGTSSYRLHLAIKPETQPRNSIHRIDHRSAHPHHRLAIACRRLPFIAHADRPLHAALFGRKQEGDRRTNGLDQCHLHDACIYYGEDALITWSSRPGHVDEHRGVIVSINRIDPFAFAELVLIVPG